MEKNERRDFLKKSFLGITGAAIIPGSLNASLAFGHLQNEMPDLPGRMLGKTGIKTPLISLGAGNVNDPNFVKASYHAGVKLFFSATYYGEGNNERLTGTGLKGLPRDSFVVGTAVTPDGFDTNKGVFTTPLDVNAYAKKAEESINRFGLDHLDIILFPYAGERDVILNESLIKVFQRLKKQGKIKFAGIATHNNCSVALRAATDSKFFDVVMTAYNFKNEKKEDINKAIDYAVKAGLGVMAMKTLAGVYRDKNSAPLNSDAALKWVLQNEEIATVVSGMSSLEELEKNVTMIRNLKISDQELKDLDIAGLKNSPGLYCHQCRECIPQCPQGLEIPTLMRSYMYAYGYKNMKQAKHTLLSAGIHDNPCGNCDTCNISCTAGFNIREKIMDISRLRTVPGEFLKG